MRPSDLPDVQIGDDVWVLEGCVRGPWSLHEIVIQKDRVVYLVVKKPLDECHAYSYSMIHASELSARRALVCSLEKATEEEGRRITALERGRK